MVIEPLNENHNRFAFSCDNEKLDRYLHELAHQSKRKGLAATFVAIRPEDPKTIAGYYSLSSCTIEGIDIPESARKQRSLPKHTVGATLLGRLAVSKNEQNRGLGALLLVDALKRAHAVSKDVGSVCVVVDAVDEKSVGFYERYDFVRVDPEKLRLVLMMDTIERLMGPVKKTFSPDVA